MKLIIHITLALVMLCFACAEIKSLHSSGMETPLATTTEIIQATESSIETERDLPAESAKQTETEDTCSKENPAIESTAEQKQVQITQSEVIPEETTPAKTGGESEIPTVIEHAKTGYDGNEPEPTLQPIPEAGETADLQTASRLKQERGITETLKAADQMRWVAEMENIRASVKEAVLNELIFR